MQGTNIDNANNTKNKIIGILKSRGPSLPTQIASQTGISSIFAGAFLSEAAKENLLKISSMKVGGSPLYFLVGQEQALEKFYTYLPGKEKEAFLLLKKKKILKDSEQQPAIRVALRALKDFAFPFRNDNEIFWRFHSVTEQEVRDIFEKPKVKIKRGEKPLVEPIAKHEQQLDIGLKPAYQIKEKVRKRKANSFLEQVISFLTKNNIELLNIEKSTNKEVFIKVKEDQKPLLLYAINKRKITDNDIIKAYKKSSELNLPYSIIAKGEPSKKLIEIIKASKSILKINKLQ